MNDSITTAEMDALPNDILSLLSPGTIRSMAIVSDHDDVSNDNWDSVASSTVMDTSPDSLGPLYTVLTYPLSVISPSRAKCGQDFSYKSGSHDFLVYDGEYCLKMTILDYKTLNEPMEDSSGTAKISTFFDYMKVHCVLISIKSYVTSTANVNQNEPVVCITGMETYQHRVLELNQQKQSLFDKTAAEFIKSGTPFPCVDGNVMGSKIADFLVNIAPSLSYEDLSGCHKNLISTTRCAFGPKSMKGNKVWDDGNSDRIDVSDNLELISYFLSRHQAISNLAMLTEGEDQEAMRDLPSSISVHMSRLVTFCKSQMERQKASITANSGRMKPTPTTAKIIEQYQDALHEIYDPGIPLINQSTTGNDVHIDMLHYYHSKLCQGLIPDAGQFRTKTIRVSNTNFVCNGKMEDSVSRLLLALGNLRTRLISTPTKITDHSSVTFSNEACTLLTATSNLHIASPQVLNQGGKNVTTRSFKSNNDRNVTQQRVLATVTYAAAVCMGILDTHPYSDGNGRLARIMLNFVLHHHLHLPFPIPLFTTPEQRLEYANVICETRQNIALLPVGDIPNVLLLVAYKACGAFQPMVDLILDRLNKSITEFNRQIVHKENANFEEVTLKSARIVRERDRNTGVCQICLKNNPNISNLCCGTAYHMNCLAQWLRNHTSCPQCRFEVPRLRDSESSLRGGRGYGSVTGADIFTETNYPRYNNFDSH